MVEEDVERGEMVESSRNHLVETPGAVAAQLRQCRRREVYAVLGHSGNVESESGERLNLNTKQSRYRVISVGPVGNRQYEWRWLGGWLHRRLLATLLSTGLGNTMAVLRWKLVVIGDVGCGAYSCVLSTHVMSISSTNFFSQSSRMFLRENVPFVYIYNRRVTKRVPFTRISIPCGEPGVRRPSGRIRPLGHSGLS